MFAIIDYYKTMTKLPSKFSDIRDCLNDEIRSEADLIISNSKSIYLDKGQILFKQSEPALNFYYVLEGCIQLKMFRQDRYQIIDLITAENCIGLLLMTSTEQMGYPVEAQSIVKSQVLEISKDQFQSIWQKNQKLSHFVHLQIQKKLINFQNQKFFHLHKLESQVAQLFTERLCYIKNLSITRSQIAEILGVSTESIIRILSAWQKQKIILTDSQKIKILNMDSLKAKINLVP